MRMICHNFLKIINSILFCVHTINYFVAVFYEMIGSFAETPILNNNITKFCIG